MSRLEEKIFVYIFEEWRNFERAKEDETLSEELTCLTVQEVEAVANLRFRKCFEIIEVIKFYD